MAERLGGIENVERALNRASTAELTELEARVAFLGTIGSAAPFVGLFGTVMGILGAFNEIAEKGNATIATVAGPIGNALLATAAGLFAAIPAVVAYNAFVASMKTELSRYAVTSTPATVPSSPGVSVTDIEWNATLPDGKKIKVNAMLTDNVRTALNTSAFRTKYEGLSTRADFIVYNGHAGLGANVRALSRSGKWVAGQYLIMFENGCDTFAYVDGSLAEGLSVRGEQLGHMDFLDFQNAFARLPAEQKEALVLIGAEGFSYEEAALICGCAVGTVKSRVNRGRARLAELMGVESGADLGGDERSVRHAASGV